LMFLGGWLSPFSTWPSIQSHLNFISPLAWLLLKTGCMMFAFLWFRATFPRYRYDQIMRLGWKVFIPITFFWIVVEALAIMFEISPWF